MVCCRRGGGCVLTPRHGRGLLDVTGLRLQVLLLHDGALRTEGYAICCLEQYILLCKETLLDMGVAEVSHKSVLQHSIEGQHCGFGIQLGGRVGCPKFTVRSQVPECHYVGTN